jgi:hypothetical protein
MKRSSHEPECLLSRTDEAALLTSIRTRAEQAAAPARISWERPERSAEREDLRTRLSLDRGTFDRLPTGAPQRGQAVKDGFFRSTLYGISFGHLVSWSDLAEGGNGAITPAQATEFYQRELHRWRRQFGGKPFFAAVAGVFTERVEASPWPNLALLAWEEGRWRLVADADRTPPLAELFYPLTPAGCAAAVTAHLDQSPHFPRLLSQVLDELGLPAGAFLPAHGKNVGPYALEYRSGHHLFYRR